MFKRLAIFALVVVMLTTLTGPALADPQLPPPALPALDRSVVERIDGGRALEHIRVLSKEIGTRPYGLENDHKAAEYIAGYFGSLGYDYQIQQWPVTSARLIGNATVRGAEAWYGKLLSGFNEWHGTVWEMGAASNGLITDGGIVSGEVISATHGYTSELTLAAGKIALIERSGSSSAQREAIQNAVDADAIGVIMYSVVGSRGNLGSTFNPSVYTGTPIPVLGAAFIQGQWLLEMLQHGPVQVDLQTWRYTGLTSQNVIATKPAKVANAPIVAITAHSDSVVGSPGAWDNGSGSAVVMELARVLQPFNTDDFELRFAVFSGEEGGMIGSNYYVNSLTAEEKARFVAAVDIDCIGTSDPDSPNLFVETVDGLPNLITESAVAAGSRLADPYLFPEEERFGSSDHVPFHRAGIPAAMFITLGGEGNQYSYHITPVYHTPQDTLEENMDPEYFEHNLKVIGATVYDIARKAVPALDNSAIRTPVPVP